jgi:hypothetical protein
MTPQPLDLVGAALSLDANGFRALLGEGTSGLRLGLLVVYLAGLSSAMGQSVALFATRVSPRRFAATLAVQALLFVGAFLVWAVSVWWLAAVAFGAPRPLANVIAAVGLAYAPQLLSFFTLAPYLGTPLQTLLSIWTLLATLVAAVVVFDLALGAAVAVSGVGWLGSQLLLRTFGQLVVRIGARVRASFPPRPGAG